LATEAANHLTFNYLTFVEAVMLHLMLMRRVGETRCGILVALSSNPPWPAPSTSAVIDRLLYDNGIEVRAAVAETVELALAVEADRWGVDEIEAWYHRHAAPLPTK
jgi:hypothetical protein